MKEFLERVFKYLKDDCFRHVADLAECWDVRSFPLQVWLQLALFGNIATNESNEAQNRRQINLCELFVNLTFNPRVCQRPYTRKVH